MQTYFEPLLKVKADSSRAVGAEVTKLVFWNRLNNVDDPNLNLWPVVLSTEVIQCASIVAACSLYLRPFLELLRSGFFNLDDMRRKGTMVPFTLVSSNQVGTRAGTGFSKSRP